jgi:hypothetical protein
MRGAHQPTRETKHLDTSMKELCFLAWAHKEAVLAVGTARGNVLLYNDKQVRACRALVAPLPLPMARDGC